ncbi:MAG: DUF1549 and DUF1553 domain-containing protein [Planctomycetes bacterium]|nr:DUF1549 and DUF1553 domain-containing protein [Planctomycetota bacterium]MCH9725784.1 DUF1549 and DUF1553 domain-containing protein [Planctomycetota bacterium]MCH9777839.1 DUF1549 and DUF1553 domain-containing protein [Planctomycetota bacterium]MCH9791018.1 DUF1549 and DUF1553 domain-containing protein [Planctomycetota bacterium]MDF1742585.1 DUF1549 domain-containing protein [Gimesia sp.]
MKSLIYQCISCLIFLSALSVQAADAPLKSSQLSAYPAKVQLNGNRARQQLLVTVLKENQPLDYTRDVQFKSDQPAIVQVSAAGVILPVSNGSTTITVSNGAQKIKVPVEVKDFDQRVLIDFERDVHPMFSRFHCNGGSCHGKQRGQGGFQLSMFAFDPEFDYGALTKESRGRRASPLAPDQSLVLLKGAGKVPHGGGKKLPENSRYYHILEQWIAEGATRAVAETPKLVKISAEPTERIMQPKTKQQMVVTAHYSDGSTRDITDLAEYMSSESVYVSVDEHGLVTAGSLMGEASIMARYLGNFASLSVTVPSKNSVPDSYYAKLPRNNFIDGLVWDKLKKYGLKPSEPVNDATFLRRVSLDIIGRTPTAEEARAFLQDSSPNKRERLIDYFLEQPEFGDHWANKWADMLRPNPYHVGIKTVLNYDAWIRRSFHQNKPLDQFTRELLTAKGGTWHNGAVTMFRDRRKPEELTTIVSQLFLGIRLSCAQCHHHPSEVWGQDDFYSFAAYFAKLGRKGRGISAPISGSEEMVFTSNSGSVRHPLTNEVLAPRPLFGKVPELKPNQDPREILADWIISPQNHFFGEVSANRIWADLMGRGIVEPIDDFRESNPPTNGPLVKALGKHFRDMKFDQKEYIKTILSSYVYSLSSLPNETNVGDSRNYSRFYRQRLRAEVLLDSISEVIGVPDSFLAMPANSTAKQLWTHRVSSVFLDSFGRPDPNQDPPCERTTETTVVQVLHMMNSREMYSRIQSPEGNSAKWAKSKMTPDQILEELYLTAYSRYPTMEEKRLGRSLFEKEKANRQQIIEDLMWALLNTPEYLFKN